MNDLIITICRDTRKVKLNRGFIGLNGENLQGNIIVDFTDIADFVDGTAYLEVNQKGEKYFIEMQKNAADKTYSLPIKSSLLRYSGNTPYQVKIEQTETENGVPVFKSEVFQVPCLEAINATETIPEQYPTRFVTKEELAENLANGEYPAVKTETLSVSAGDYKSKIVQHEDTPKDITVKLPTEDGTLLTEEKAEEVYTPKGYRLIQDITLEEDIQNIDISTDKDGKALKLKGVFARFYGQFTGTAGSRMLRLDFNGGQTYQMYTNYTVEIGVDHAHFIKSERINKGEYERYIYISQFPKTLCKPQQGAVMQGLADMIRDLQCDYSEAALSPNIKRIRYGQKDSTAGLMAKGSRILIWGIDNDE